jgi:hypothetical protein
MEEEKMVKAVAAYAFPWKCFTFNCCNRIECNPEIVPSQLCRTLRYKQNQGREPTGQRFSVNAHIYKKGLYTNKIVRSEPNEGVMQ